MGRQLGDSNAARLPASPARLRLPSASRALRTIKLHRGDAALGLRGPCAAWCGSFCLDVFLRREAVVIAVVVTGGKSAGLWSVSPRCCADGGRSSRRQPRNALIRRFPCTRNDLREKALQRGPFSNPRGDSKPPDANRVLTRTVQTRGDLVCCGLFGLVDRMGLVELSRRRSRRNIALRCVT
jgi:hypothetical protein